MSSHSPSRLRTKTSDFADFFRLSHPVSSSTPESGSRHPPVPTIVPPSGSSSSSLGVKFAAHFTNAKSRNPPSRISRAAYSEGDTSESLLPPPSPRQSSFDSGPSAASINLTSDSSSNNAIRTDAGRRASRSEDRRSSQSSNGSVRHSASSKGSESVLGPDEISEQPATSTIRSAQDSSIAPVIDVRPPSPPTRKLSSPGPRSVRVKTPTSERLSRPPSIPLPPPPNSNPPIAVPALQPVFSTRTPVSSSGLRRPRAHTVGSIPPVPRGSPPSPPSSPGIPKRARSPVDKGAAVKQTFDKENINLNTATIEELKQALASRSQQYEDLASHLLKVTAAHVAEKNALEKKISTLEKDLARKDKEIKGLTWIIVNHRISLGGSDVESALNSAQLAYRPADPTRTPSRLRRTIDESAAESHQTSGAESVSESILGSGASGTESHSSSLPVKKIRRPMLGETTFNLYRSSSRASRRLGLGVESMASDSSVRSSVYSLSSSSAASSSSSLLPPGSSGTGSSLSAIPEGPNQVSSSRSTKVMRERGSLSAGEDERHPTRPNRISTSSLASSSSMSSAATSAYSANLKRSRPPSIAQVLEKSSAVEDVLQKLRPFKSTANAP
ncbi:hypothetical protein L208DRAFT_1457751 [Tricholoma matsutake]|nr:hypothetical protein L208DRAFT_1457751 [Tricholoma matsutake 945]